MTRRRDKYLRAVVCGVLGTAVMTAFGVWVVPLIGLPPTNPADMLANRTGGNMPLAWAGHFMVGSTLAAIYALVAPSIPGPPAVQGALYSLAPWFVAQTVVMPVMGLPFFSGSAPLATSSLVAHVVYGAVTAVAYSRADPPRAGTAA